jgi:SAM-dependent methyltransferase
MNTNYKEIIKHYEDCLEKHGDTHLGVDWPKLEDVDKRYHVMLDIIRVNNDIEPEISLLDFGCGTAHLLEFIHKNNFNSIKYSGLDISEKFISVAKEKYPSFSFYCEDIFNDTFILPSFNYIVMNGVFTEKRGLSFDEMWAYFKKLIGVLYNKCDKGLAFNVMSKNVDWEREDLFHLSTDLVGDFLCKEISRNYIIRNDYGLFEYTVYILKK